MPVIGVAVAIPEPWGSELESWRASFGDPQAAAVPAHVTVLPPTTVADADLPGIEAHLAAAAARVAPFAMQLRGTGTFRPVSPVVFVVVAAGIAGCEELERAVRHGPLARELEHPYHPHVTVAHHLPDDVLDRAYAALAAFRASFVVDEVVLHVHDDGAWTPTAVFPLAGTATD